MNLPITHEEQIIKLANNPDFKDRNWLEMEADKHGVDYDHIRGFDDEFSKKENDTDN